MNEKMKQNKGSALVWVLVIAAIFTIIGVSIGWIALSMNQRSINNYTLQQNYFTSRSAVDALFNQLNGINDANKYEGSMCQYLHTDLLNGAKEVNFEDFFGTQDTNNAEIAGMGKCKVKGTYDKGQVTITATTGESATDKETVQLEAYRKSSGTEWPAEGWSTQLELTNPTVGAKNSITNKNAQDANLDVAVYTVYNTVSGTLTLSKDRAMEKKAIFIYIKEGAILNISGIKTSGKKVARWFADGKTDDWSNYYGPDVFIYIEPGGTLAFSAANKSGTDVVPYPFYIVGGIASNEKKATVKSEVTGAIKVYYHQNVVQEVNSANDGAWLKYDGEKNQTPERVTISGYKENGTPATEGSGIISDQWTILKYSDGSGE